jgi:predicted ATPase
LEEPENGVHPRRLELIAKLFISLARYRSRQVIVTTHSPLFCDTVLRESGGLVGDTALFNVRRGDGGTEIRPFHLSGPLFEKQEIAEALEAEAENGLFESLILRGMIDE